jgi:hypothetical protein
MLMFRSVTEIAEHVRSTPKAINSSRVSYKHFAATRLFSDSAKGAKCKSLRQRPSKGSSVEVAAKR